MVGEYYAVVLSHQSLEQSQSMVAYLLRYRSLKDMYFETEIETEYEGESLRHLAEERAHQQISRSSPGDALAALNIRRLAPRRPLRRTSG